MHTAGLLWIVTAASLSVNVIIVRAQEPTGRRNPTAAALKNPVGATPESVRRGRQAYMRACRQCHGENGAGDGPLAPKSPPPPNLTDATWDHGSTDGEIYNVIANGAGGDSPMKGMRSVLTTREMWDIVNYLRSIGPQQP